MMQWGSSLDRTPDAFVQLIDLTDRKHGYAAPADWQMAASKGLPLFPNGFDLQRFAREGSIPLHVGKSPTCRRSEEVACR